MIHLKRVYEPSSAEDGQRILVERLWPRGLSKEKASIDVWLKDIAPSTMLRKWYNHDLSKWPEFQIKYTEELKANEPLIVQLKKLLKKNPTTFVYAARDEEHNNAVILKDFLENH